MKSHHLGRQAVAVLLAQCVAASVFAAGKYTVTEIKPPGAVFCSSVGLDASGQVAGTFFTDANYINNAGQITAVSNDQRGYLLTPLR